MASADIEADMFWNIPLLFHRVPVLNFYYENAFTLFSRFLPTCLRRRDTCRITAFCMWLATTGRNFDREKSETHRKGSSVLDHGPYRDHVNRQSMRKDYVKLLWAISGRRFYFEKNHVCGLLKPTKSKIRAVATSIMNLKDSFIYNE